MDVSVSGLTADSAVVGKTTNFSATASEPGDTRYRFRIRRPGGDYQMIRDFGPLNTLAWASDREGTFEMEVSAKNAATNDVATTVQTFRIGSRVVGKQPVVSPTDHPLVFLFSAPGCPAGGRMRVQFQAAGGAMQQTPFKSCTPATSMNFLLAGLYAETQYSAQAVLDSGIAVNTGDSLTFTTGKLPPFSWSQTVRQAAPANEDQPFLLATSGGSQIATDLTGKVVWFNPSPVTYSTRFETGGFLWGYLEDDSKPVEQQGIRKVDLLGHTILETNAARVNEQLAARGKSITGFHHEVRTLPDGRILAMASTERLVNGLQGPGIVDVLGDMIIVFDRNLQVEWVWDSFDNLDVTRKATLGDTCAPGGGGCAPFRLANVANDWTHGNALQQTPDGNILYSARHQDWLIKIAYENGEGDGHIIWRLGKDGDFSFTGDDAYPWFSHQHDGNFISANRLMVFDNGNTRIAQQGGNSRAQIIQLDETNRTATLLLNKDLGVNSIAVGSAQRLSDGNYHFDAGYVPANPGIKAFAFEIDKTGNTVSVLEANTLLYRSIRLADMYSVN